MRRCIAVLFSIIMLLICLYGKKDVQAEEPVKLYAGSAVLMDADTGRILYGKEQDKQRPMASTTKIMTLILALEYGNMDDYVTVSDYAAKMPDVQLGINSGEQYRLEDLLYSMMLESHNDSACAVAEHIGGSVEGFAEMMNQKARELGLDATYFITPNGLDAKDKHGIHSTTAAELAQIMRYCVFISEKKDKFREICQTRSYSFADREQKRQFTVNNKNALLDQMEGVLAGKTGFTGEAGYCYVAAVNRNGKNFIVALLACGWPNHKTYKWADTKALLTYGDENYQYREIQASEFDLSAVPVEKGQSGTVRGHAEGSFKMLLSKSDQISVREIGNPGLQAPIEEGSSIGNLVVYVNREAVAAYPIYADSYVKEKNFEYYMHLVLYEFF